MTAPAGPCEWCGGPQWWTFVRGVMYVRCQGGCQSLFPEERVGFSRPVGDDPLGLLSRVIVEPYRDGGVVPFVGGDAKGDFDDDLPW